MTVLDIIKQNKNEIDAVSAMINLVERVPNQQFGYSPIGIMSSDQLKNITISNQNNVPVVTQEHQSKPMSPSKHCESNTPVVSAEDSNTKSSIETLPSTEETCSGNESGLNTGVFSDCSVNSEVSMMKRPMNPFLLFSRENRRRIAM